MDLAIRSLNELRLASVENFSAAAVKSDVMDKANVPPQGTRGKLFGIKYFVKVLSLPWIG